MAAISEAYPFLAPLGFIILRKALSAAGSGQKKENKSQSVAPAAGTTFGHPNWHRFKRIGTDSPGWRKRYGVGWKGSEIETDVSEHRDQSNERDKIPALQQPSTN
jgi:hypothetical protein